MTQNGQPRVKDFWLNRRVLITGANGFLGSHLTRRLVKVGAQVSVFLRPESHRLRLRDILPRVQVVEGDLVNSDSVRKAVADAQPELVYHLAAAGITPGIKDETVLVVNVLGTFYLLEASASYGVSKFVYTGSCFEYGAGSNLSENHPVAPTSAYATSKVAGHVMAHAFGRNRNLPVVSVRPFTPYGPWERTTRLVPYTIISALKGEDIRMTRAEQERDYVYVDDVIEGFLLLGEHPKAVEHTFNICSGQATRIRDVASQILALLGHPVRVLFGALPYRVGEMFQQSGDNTLARTVLGWVPQVSLREGLQRTIEWYRANLSLAEQLT